MPNLLSPLSLGMFSAASIVPFFMAASLRTASDILVGIAYLLLPLAIWRFLKTRPASRSRWLNILFATLVLACGFTHLAALWSASEQVHQVDALMKLAATIASLPTVLVFLRELSRENDLPRPQVLLASIVESSDDAIISKDLAGKITSWNAAAERIYGYSREEAMGQSISMLAAQDRAEEMPDILAKVAQGAHIRHYETRRTRKDGQCIDVSLTVSPICNDQGKIVGASVISRDITEHKRTEEQFRRQATLLDQSHDAIIVRSLDGVISYWSSGAERLYGFWQNDAIGQISHKLLQIDHPLGIRHFSEALFRDGRWTGELSHVTRDGRKITVESDQVVVRERSNERTLVLETNRDITERKANEASLAHLNAKIRESEERFRTLAEAVPVILWSCLPDGQINYTSTRFAEYTGSFEDANLREQWIAAIHPDDRNNANQAWELSVHSGDPFRADFRLRRHDGVYRWFTSQAVPMRDRDGRIEQWLGSCADVDDLKSTEAALVRSNNELRQFAYAAAHDLQEPMRNVSLSLSMLQTIHEDLLNSEAKEWFKASIEGSRRMQTMVRDLLEYSRVVDNSVHSQVASDSSKALSLALTNLQTAIAETGTEVRHSDLPIVKAEEVHVLQLFQNLISNSIKYRKRSERPHVTISVERENGNWVFSVGDNGIGFDPAYADQIFGVFKRLHTRAEFPGNGIGLSLCARIVAHYGGRIWAEAEPDHGATFRFTLPATQASQEANG